MRNLLDITDFTKQELAKLIAKAEDIIANPTQYSEVCKGKKLATLFFEPSTRTRLSFEAAMYELGGNVLGFQSAVSSSTSKGETVGDTVRTVSNYADIIAMRHSLEGAPYAAVRVAKVPIINAGDGGHNHPTQTLADLLTLHRRLKRLDNLTIGLCGDLKYGRTVHSLIRAMSVYENVRFVLISPNELKLPTYLKEEMTEKKIFFYETADMEEKIKELDVLYMTRVQQERFDSAEEYERLKDCYVLTAKKLSGGRKELCVLHPLPRVNEISVDVDDDPRACYFEQTANGKYMRMALILKLLEETDKQDTARQAEKTEIKCTNKKCITASDSTLKSLVTHTFDGKYRCYYCETEVPIEVLTIGKPK